MGLGTESGFANFLFTRRWLLIVLFFFSFFLGWDRELLLYSYSAKYHLPFVVTISTRFVSSPGH
jgi:hypothetical protein